jgi:N-succinyldiaminopimelate aminotransferase
MNSRLEALQPYPFQRLARLLADVLPPAGKPAIRLSIGEPKHPTPKLISATLVDHLDGLARYPLTKGEPELRAAISEWLQRRFDLPHDIPNPDTHILPVNGTREALFALAQCVIDDNCSAKAVLPNPFYQIYEGAALLAGAEPFFLECRKENGFIPDFGSVTDSVWNDCQLLYICSPGNPTGAVIGEEQLQTLINLADKHDFIIASDECYSDIYPDEDNPPPGLLGAAVKMGNDTFQHCVVFHSLSKRSNAPGLRSGFVAGNADILRNFLLYRTYHGCAMSPVVQAASTAAWGDESHVIENRRLYRKKFTAVQKILAPVLSFEPPAGGFYLWPETPEDDTLFAQRLYSEQNITVLPGSYLSRKFNGHNPGTNRIRLALVVSLDECIAAAEGIRSTLETL